MVLGVNPRISGAVGKGGQDSFGGRTRVAAPRALEEREIVQL